MRIKKTVLSFVLSLAFALLIAGCAVVEAGSVEEPVEVEKIAALEAEITDQTSVDIVAERPVDPTCSYNGDYNAGANTCTCDPGWFGASCQRLHVGPAQVNSGYRPEGFDSWGAAVLLDEETGLYHMWVSQIANHCDITYWARNSMTVHATSVSPDGPFTYVDDAFPVMTHEIDVQRGPNGEWIAFFTGGLDQNGQVGPSEYGPACDCDPQTQEPLPGECETGASTEPTLLSIAQSPNGPWSDPIVIIDPAPLPDGIDTNFSAAILDDGSLVGLWRTYPGASQVHWVTASNYADPSTYVFQDDETPLLPPPYDGFTVEGLEDMFVWHAANRGVFHAIFHDMVVPPGAAFYDGLGHAYSLDGTTWVYTGEAATSRAVLVDGTVLYSARARPHLIFENGLITHLISAEQGTEDGFDYTLIEPIILE